MTLLVWGIQAHGRSRIIQTGTPKVCNIMAFMAIIMGLGLLFYIPLGV